MANNQNVPKPAATAAAPAPATVATVQATVTNGAGATVPVLPALLQGARTLAMGSAAVVALGRPIPGQGNNGPYAAALAAALATGGGKCTVQVAVNYCTAAGNAKFVNYCLKASGKGAILVAAK